MNRSAALANAGWLASSVAATRRFRRALSDPAGTQRTWLQSQVTRHAPSQFGQTHDFASIATYAEFARRVPFADYSKVMPYIARIQRGESQVLSVDPVTHLAPTSGSSGARKLIPFTRGLSAAFDSAVAPWMANLARQRPRLLGGPAYWSVSPLAQEATHPSSRDDDSSVVPIGFADDAEYLGAAKAWLVRQVLAVPASVRHVRDERAFWCLSLLAMLRQSDLRLISVWHPTFLELLVTPDSATWSTLLDAVASGANPWSDALPTSARREWDAPANPARAATLRQIGASEWSRWWPRLQVVSCWGEQAAESGWHRLKAQLATGAPQALVQRKGLLATEAVVTVPIDNALPLAVTSHFFEFISDNGDIRLAHELQRGAHYKVCVSNGGGLWRYQLGDVVECTGHVQATPTLRFLGRGEHTSDLRGEKLAEPFVAEALRELWDSDASPAVAMLRGWDSGDAAGYELVMSGETSTESPAQVVQRLEHVLQANPHYALARRLGQLSALRVVVVAADSEQNALRAGRGTLGDVKPRALVRALPGNVT
ncbi:MAG: GH3 auxin-responsive promoter family protein [Gemmatimonas sp.]